MIFKLREDLSFDVGAMAEPLACVVHGIDQAGIVPGQTVLVIGGGTIGLLMVQMARIEGASTVILSEPVEQRRQIGLELGADAVIDVKYGSSQVMAGAAEVIAYGTAVKILEGEKK